METKTNADSPSESAYPIDAKAQYDLALTVKCPWCDALAGERCTPSLVFPQYPHTLRVDAAFNQKRQAKRDRAHYDFGSIRDLEAAEFEEDAKKVGS